MAAPTNPSEGNSKEVWWNNDQTFAMAPPVSGVSAAVPSSQALAITTSGANYIVGSIVGGIISITNVNYATGRRVVLESITIKEKGGAAPSLHIEFYKATPSGGTYTDNSQLVRGTGDAANRVGVLSVLAADYLTDVTETTVTYSGLELPLTVGATTLFMLLISQGSYTLTNGNLTMELQFRQQ